MRIESNANFSVTLSKQRTHYHLLYRYCQHLNKSSSSVFRPALPNLWLLLVIIIIINRSISPRTKVIYICFCHLTLNKNFEGIALMICNVYQEKCGSLSSDLETTCSDPLYTSTHILPNSPHQPVNA